MGDYYYIISFLVLNNVDVCSHVYYMSGDAWKEGGIDATGEHLLITSNLNVFHS